MQTVKEVHIPSKDASARPEYLFLGLSDSALLELAEGDFTLLSADAKLCLSAANAGCEAVNFNHLRNF